MAESLQIVVGNDRFDVAEREPGVYDFTWLTATEGETSGFFVADPHGQAIGSERLRELAESFVRNAEADRVDAPRRPVPGPS